MSTPVAALADAEEAAAAVFAGDAHVSAAYFKVAGVEYRFGRDGDVRAQAPRSNA